MDLENVPLQLVPVEDPNYARLPWAGRERAWAAQGFFTLVIIGAVIALIWTYCGAKRDRNSKTSSSANYDSTAMYSMKSVSNAEEHESPDTADISEQSGLNEKGSSMSRDVEEGNSL